MAEARGIRFWYTPEDFADKDTPARRLIRSSRQWFALAVEVRFAAAQVMGVEQEDLIDEFERTEAALRKALARALDKARDEVTRR